MTQAPAGGPAQTTYQVASRQGVIGREAQRVFVVSDGRTTEGGPQQAVYYVNDAEIASGEFVVSGNKPIPITEVSAQGAEYPPIAVYVVTADSASDFPPTVEPGPEPDPIGDALRADAVAYWTLDEESGTRIDATGNGHDAAPANAPALVDGVVNGAIHFDRLSSQKLTVADHADLRNDGNLYLFGWIKVLSENDGITYYGATHITKTDQDLIWEYEVYSWKPAEQDYQLVFYMSNSGDDSSVIYTPMLTDQWYFVEAYYRASDGEMGMAVNGGAFSTGALSGSVETTTAVVSIGADPSGIGFNSDAHQDEWGILKPASVPIDADSRAYLYNDGAGRALFPAP